MIKTKLDLGQDELKVLREIFLANSKLQKGRKIGQVVCVIGAFIMGIDTLVCYLNHLIGYALLSLVLAVILIWGAKAGIYFEQDVIYKMLENKALGDLKGATIEYIFDSDGLITISESEHVTSKYKWDAFQGWSIFKNYVYLQIVHKRIALVKISNLTLEDYDSLISLLSTHVQQKEIRY